MSDVLVRFTANVSYRCVGDMVHLSAAERKAVDKEAKFLEVHPAYEVIEPKAKEQATEPEALAEEPAPVAEEVVETPVDEAPVETEAESAEEPAQPEIEASEPEATEPETTPVVETKSKSKKGAK